MTWTAEQARKGQSWAVFGPLDKGCREEICRCISWQREERARTIASAPDMLAFIEHWRDVIQGGDKLATLEGWAREFVTEANAIISKAKG